MSERPPVDHELVVLVGEELRTFDLPAQAEVTLGRDESNQVRIEHPSVSRRHAVVRMGAQIVVEDLGGANGTFVRDRAQLEVHALGLIAYRLLVGESYYRGAVMSILAEVIHGAPTAPSVPFDTRALNGIWFSVDTGDFDFCVRDFQFLDASGAVVTPKP